MIAVAVVHSLTHPSINRSTNLSATMSKPPPGLPPPPPMEPSRRSLNYKPILTPHFPRENYDNARGYAGPNPGPERACALGRARRDSSRGVERRLLPSAGTPTRPRPSSSWCLAARSSCE